MFVKLKIIHKKCDFVKRTAALHLPITYLLKNLPTFSE